MCRPEHSLSPRALFCRHEAQAEGSLGTYVPREDTVGGCRPRRKPRGLLLGTPFRPWDAVPNEVRDARLALGRTELGSFLKSLEFRPEI